MSHRVCPVWMGYLLASPLRRLIQKPEKIVAPYVREGMTVLEPGPGMGFFTLEIARRVGPEGRVIAVDIQPGMLERLRRRAAKAGLAERVVCRVAKPDSMGLADLHGTIDFALAFAVVHEMPSAAAFFAEVSRVLKPGATTLFAEPSGHVDRAAFDREILAAAEAGLEIAGRPEISRSIAAVLRKT